ncbi:uncharacterized protein LOC119568310 [Penaeus monodon]|uniref:uncharacterized protein LOC119568310 n=1 Tax=Penaeus monodon TaxID=6687 RepID=UPI0018A79518|nr:uncharacterized protein LOC119568310 [Penaeus monodon]
MTLWLHLSFDAHLNHLRKTLGLLENSGMKLKEVNTCLCLPDFDRPFEIHTDASGQALGAVLLNWDADRPPHAVAYWSRILRDAESRYPIIDWRPLDIPPGEPTRSVYDCPAENSNAEHESNSDAPLLEIPPSVQDQQVQEEQPRQMPNLTSLASHQIREEQLQDPVCSDLIAWLKRHRVVKQIYVSRHLYKQALHMAHQPPMAAHPGALRTYQYLRNNWFFLNMLHLARTYVAGCETCQLHKTPVVRAPMQGSQAPLEMVSTQFCTKDFNMSCPSYMLYPVGPSQG